MDKQEFQQKVKNMKHSNFFTAITINEAYEAGFEEAKGNALFESCFLDEPEKPVVPQYVADFYESIKDDFEDKLYELCLQFNNDSDDLPREIWWWFDCGKNEPIQTLVKMKIYGYEVEKEKLYTVEIPNPNGSGYSKTYLAKNKDGKVELFTWSGYTSIEFADDWKQEKNAQLTEKEIKKDYAWAWQFAKEVENETKI